ncbi:sarcosine oxidase subunit gamma [Oryzifoliimicrobium ureilyticus]|uniref:sarcosine oxidase subunit gamma n=1 Tax=Oryzifoliimicrobium ureilyticus TaxID=3113724 RepID=UPI0030761816
MSEPRLDFKSGYQTVLRAVLSAKETVFSDAIRLSPLPEGTIIHVLAAQGAADMESHLRALNKGDVRAVSPGQWFIVRDEVMPHTEMAAFFTQLKPQATAVDQSHGRVRMRIEGRMVERALAKGTAVDLSIKAFAVGQSAMTLIGHITAHLTRVEEHAFEIIVLRGFAESLWDDLVRISLEFG